MCTQQANTKAQFSLLYKHRSLMHNIPNTALIQSLPPMAHQDRGQGVEPLNHLT